MTARSYSRSLGSVGRNKVDNLVSLFLEVHMLTRRSILAAGGPGPACRQGSDLALRDNKDRDPVCRGRTVRWNSADHSTGSAAALGRHGHHREQARRLRHSGAAAVAKSPPDGNTWLFTSDTFVVSPLLMTNPPFNVKQDFEPVTLVGRAPEVLCAHHARPYRSLGDLIADAKAKPETISYGTSGTGGIAHLTTVLLSQRTGMRLVHVPDRGMGPAVNDAVAGHVDLIMGSTSALGQQIGPANCAPWSSAVRNVPLLFPTCQL